MRRIVAIGGLAAALALALYPSVSGLWHRHLAQQQRSELEDVYDDPNDPARLSCLAQARAYNEQLAGRTPAERPAAYGEQLSYRGRPEIAWIEIPAIDVSLPVYRTAGEEELSAGVGHLETSALPVGGRGTRCVLSAHSGMTGSRMFDDLPRLVEGDVFTVWTLGEPYSYRVCEFRVVSPDDAGAVAPEEGRDLCTLLTCSSSGEFGLRFTRLNDVRLLVTGERCPWEPSGGEHGGPDAVAGPDAAWAVIGASGVLLAGTATAVRMRRRGVRGDWSEW